jgi:hypothetical protein
MELRPVARAYDDERDPADDGDSAEDGRDGDGLLLLMLDLQRAHVNVLLLMGKGEAAHGEADDSKDNQKNSNYDCSFHVRSPVILLALSWWG